MAQTFVEVPGGRIAVQTYGGAGRDVLFIHSVGLCGPHWRPFAEIVADRCRPVTIDLPGHGHTTVPMNSAEDQWRHLAAVVRGVGLDRPVIVAHDTAVWAAMAAALDDPDAFSAVVLVGGTITRILQSLSLLDDPTFRDLMRDRFGLGETGVGRESAAAFQRQLSESIQNDWLLNEIGARLWDELDHSIVFGPGDTWIHTPTVDTVIQGYRFDPASPYYPDLGLYGKLTLPTWIVSLEHGSDGNIGLETGPAEQLPLVQVRRLATGQFPEYTGAAELAEVLDEVLQTLERA
ncbi:MAG: alpha/beta hydrolase [Austwickia sp.]|nr:alpha/beta hydrolase [Actinomycetota bacterium]MCB1253202.1 alpha/beta hydrolase [Austwickia sp.]MCO5308593.1 alpha/beta hydrolase [Austwickia sp.]